MHLVGYPEHISSFTLGGCKSLGHHYTIFPGFLPLVQLKDLEVLNSKVLSISVLPKYVVYEQNDWAGLGKWFAVEPDIITLLIFKNLGHSPG
jgi:hypothetical protein